MSYSLGFVTQCHMSNQTPHHCAAQGLTLKLHYIPAGVQSTPPRHGLQEVVACVRTQQSIVFAKDLPTCHTPHIQHIHGHASRVTLSNPFIFSTTKASRDLILRLSARADAGSREEIAACMLLLSEMLCCKKNASAFCRLATRLPKNWLSNACNAAARDCMLARNTLPRTGMSSLSSPSSAAAAACVAPTLAAAV